MFEEETGELYYSFVATMLYAPIEQEVEDASVEEQPDSGEGAE